MRQSSAGNLQNVTACRAARNAVLFFVRARCSSTLHKMHYFLFLERLFRNYESSQPPLSITERPLFEALSKSEMCALCRLLSKHFIENNTPTAIGQHVRLSQAVPLYNLELSPPNLESVMFGDAVFLNDCGLKLRQEVVTSKTLHSAVNGKFVVVTAQKETIVFPQGETGFFFSVLIGKAVAVFLFAAKRASGSSYPTIAKCRSSGFSQYVTLSFVKWYEFFDRRKLKVDSIVKTLDCSRLRWQRTPAEHDSSRVGSKYVLILIESIRGAVLVVPRDNFLS